MGPPRDSVRVFDVFFVCLAFISGCLGPAEEESRQSDTAVVLEIPTRFPDVQRLVAVGDLHGDLEATRRALTIAGAIDATDGWIGGDLTLVQLGDILDRGDDAAEILELFDGLSEQARASGGDVQLLNGNHELMNVKLDLRYVSLGGYLDLLPEGRRDLEIATAQDVVEAVGERVRAYRPGGPMALKLAQRNVVSIVGDTVFVHGGVLPHVVDYGLERLNQETRDWIRGDLRCPPEPLFGDDGPVWSRHYSDQPDAEDCRLLETTLGRLGARRMVVGHTVQEGGISPACDGLVWRSDVGMAEHYGGQTAVVEVSDGEIRVLE